MSQRLQGAKFSYCFIITYGRSGSTLLQGILNTIPGFLIRGENGGVLYKMHELYAGAADLNRLYGPDARTPAHPWFGIDRFSREKFIAGLRRLFEENFLNPAPDTRCVGFKEIRYGQDVMEHLSAHLDFIERLFPRAAFIFNSRRLEDTAQSSWWKTVPDALTYLTEYERRMQAAFDRARDRGKNNYFWANYDDYVQDPETLRSLFEFLEEPFDSAAIAKVFSSDYGLDRQTFRD